MSARLPSFFLSLAENRRERLTLKVCSTRAAQKYCSETRRGKTLYRVYYRVQRMVLITFWLSPYTYYGMHYTALHRTAPHAYTTVYQKPAGPIGFPSVALPAELTAMLPAASLTV